MPASLSELAELGWREQLRFYGRILHFFRASWGWIATLLALIWLSLSLGILEGLLIAVLFDAVLMEKAPQGLAATYLMRPLGGVTRHHQVLLLSIAWLFTRGANDTLTLLREMINNRLRYDGTARVRRTLFDHLQMLSPAYHRAQPQGDAIYRLSFDALGFFGVLDTTIGAANSVLTVFVIAVVMAQFNSTITLVCISLAPLLLLANWFFSRTIRTTSLASKQADTDFTTFVQRAMATVTLAQLFGRQRTEASRFRRAVDRTVREGMRMSWQQQLFPWSQRLLYALGHAFILGYGGFLVWRQTGPWAGNRATVTTLPPFTVGDITAMLVYLGQLWEPVRRMAGFTADVQTNVAACVRVFRVLDLPPNVADAPTAASLPVRPRMLSLEHVGFKYEQSARPVLADVNAEISPGQMVAFVGRSGAGKSTLLSLIPRFYDPNTGRVALDGQDLRSIRLASIRQHIALVPQDSPVVAGSIRENIAFGRRGATDKEVRSAAQLAGADGFIQELPNGYLTEVNEAGQNLSGGQRQRLAIARALLSDAPILVLDEPTSGLDRHHERLILQTLHRLKGTRTIILVTHHLELVRGCDRIYVVAGGSIAEAGSHEELVARDGLYTQMLMEELTPPVEAAMELSDDAAA